MEERIQLLLMKQLLFSSFAELFGMKYLLTFLFSIVFLSLQAQILNVQKATLEKDTSKVKGTITGNLNLYNRSAAADEEVEFFGYDIKSSIGVFFKNSTLAFMNDFGYTELNGEKLLNTGYQHVRYTINEDKSWKPEFFAQFQHDDFRGLFPRWLAGASIRHDLINGEDFSFFYAPGFMYEYEVWQRPNSDGKVEVDYLKYTNYFGLRWDVNKGLDLNMIAYFQTGYDKNEALWRNRYSLELNINSAISKRFQLNNNFSIMHESEPIVNITPTIYKLSVGVSYKL